MQKHHAYIPYAECYPLATIRVQGHTSDVFLQRKELHRTARLQPWRDWLMRAHIASDTRRSGSAGTQVEVHAVLLAKVDTPVDPTKSVSLGSRVNCPYTCTFCENCAMSSTSEKSYMPNAVSNSRSASTRKMTYFAASSTTADSVSNFSFRKRKNETISEGKAYL